MTITFEQGRGQDLDEMEQFYDEINQNLTETVNYPGWIKGFYPVRETAAEAIREGTLYLARSEGRIAASVIIRHRPEPEYHQICWGIDADYADIFVVYTLAVHPDFLKQGIGRQVMEFIRQKAANEGIKAIRLDVYENNLPAVKLYEQCGFKRMGSVDLGYADYGLESFRLYEKIICG